MATQIVELTGDEKRLFQSIDRLIQKELAHERQLAAMGDAGASAGVGIEDALARVNRANERDIGKLLRDLGKIGPEGKAAADELKSSFAEEGKFGFKGLDDVIEDIRKIDPAAADAAAAVRDRFREADRDSEFRNTLASLERLGDEGRIIAKGIEKDLLEAEKTSAVGMDSVLEKIRQMRPEAAASAERIQAELAEAAKFSEGKFSETLDELRKLGPVGKEVAGQLKQQLVEAGQLAEKSIDDVIAKIRKIDPAAAESAEKLYRNIDDASKRGESSWVRFGKSAVTQITTVIGAYVGVSEAIQTVNRFLEEQNELLTKALDRQQSLAKAQQEAAKNLAGLSVVDRNELLQGAVPEIAASTGFSDIGEITQALGAVASAGESSPERISNAVRQAARIERLTPENLDSTAASASAVQRQSGLDDIRQAIALVETTGTQARITDPAKLLESLPKAVGSAVSTVENQNKEQAAREAAALFSQVTQFGNDELGRASATFTTDFAVRLGKFFTGLEDERIKARSQVELIDRKIEKGKDTELDRQKREQAIAFVKASDNVVDPGELFKRIEILQSDQALSDRFKGEGFGEKQFQVALEQLLDSNSRLTSAMESSFQTIRADVAFFEREADQLSKSTPQLAIAAAGESFKASVAGKEGFDIESAALAQVREITKEAAIASRGTTLEDFFRKLTRDGFIGSGRLEGGTAIEEAVSGIAFLQERIEGLAAGGFTPQESQQVKILEGAVGAIEGLATNLVESGSLNPENSALAAQRAGRTARSQVRRIFGEENPEVAATLKANNERLLRLETLLEKQLEVAGRTAEAIERSANANESAAAAAEETAANTAPREPEPVDYGNIQRGRDS